MTMDPDTKGLTTLAQRLAAATAARSARWQRGEGDVYVWASKGGSVTVVSRDRDDEPPYELAVFSPSGEKVDELASALLEDDRPAPWNEALVDLYRAAKRSALGADDIIEALIDALPATETDGERAAERSLLARARRSASPAGDTS
jgi:hypothetical protein